MKFRNMVRSDGNRSRAQVPNLPALFFFQLSWKLDTPSQAHHSPCCWRRS